MRILLLGYSDIARRRVLPAIAACGIAHVDVASRSSPESVAWPEGLGGDVYDDYDAALRLARPDLVWISTINSTHAALAGTALTLGAHVVIDKPATLRPADTEHLLELARRGGRLLAEATVYPFHPQVDAVRRLFADAGSAVTQAVAAFSFPPLPAGNFRHAADLGGGALFDLGPYAVSIGRVFLDAAPVEIVARALPGDQRFSVLADYGEGRTVTGHFGATTGYANRLTLLGPRIAVHIDRAFTTAPGEPARIEATVDNAALPVVVAPADSFAVFVAAVRHAIAREDHAGFAEAMLADARALDRLRSAANG